MNLTDTDFEIFAVPERFRQDRAALDTRWKDLQREAHPDRFAGHGPAAQRLAMQWSARINEAYGRLKDPVARAGYLCKLHGVPLDAEQNTAMPAEFLVQQMAWREALDDADGVEALEALHAQVAAARGEHLDAISRAIDEQGDYARAAQQVRAIMFVERFAQDLEARIDQQGQ